LELASRVRGQTKRWMTFFGTLLPRGGCEGPTGRLKKYQGKGRGRGITEGFEIIWEWLTKGRIVLCADVRRRGTSRRGTKKERKKARANQRTTAKD